jgi:hypothetical protein
MFSVTDKRHNVVRMLEIKLAGGLAPWSKDTSIKAVVQKVLPLFHVIVLCLGIESALDIFKYFYGLVATRHNLSPSFFYFIAERRKCKYGILAFLIIFRKKTA